MTALPLLTQNTSQSASRPSGLDWTTTSFEPTRIVPGAIVWPTAAIVPACKGIEPPWSAIVSRFIAAPIVMHQAPASVRL